MANVLSNSFISARLKNIEETEKAKRIVAEGRQERKKLADGEEQLAATRCMSSLYNQRFQMLTVHYSLPTQLENEIRC